MNNMCNLNWSKKYQTEWPGSGKYVKMPVLELIYWFEKKVKEAEFDISLEGGGGL